jgi:predicted nucleic-acid-binding protein
VTAVDTNVVVRVLAADDKEQTAAAELLFATEPIWIAKTVLLETFWVLRSFYGFEDSAIVASLTKLLGLKNVHAEDESSVGIALSLATHGVDFADGLHLSSRPPGARFASFDRSLIRRANRAGLADVAEI